MKTIGVIGAMEEEISSLKTKIDLITTKNIVGIDFYLGKLHGKNIVLVKSGIGKVNAAICTQIIIDLYAADYCINIGVAGAISKELEIGDIVISNDTVNHDFDATSFNHEKGVIPQMEESYFPADQKLISLADKIGKEHLDSNIFIGRIATGDQFIDNTEEKQRIWSNFKALCVEMEGAAIAQTCYLNKIPFVIIRSISDKADGQAGIAFDKFLKQAATNSSLIVENMIKELS